VPGGHRRARRRGNVGPTGWPRMDARRPVARPQDRKGRRASKHGCAAGAAPGTAWRHEPGRARAVRNLGRAAQAGHGSDAQPAPGLQAPRVPPIPVYGLGQSVHPPRLPAVPGTAAISWRRWSERRVTFSVPAASWSSVASCVEVTERGWRAAITSNTACWRAVRWLAESRRRAVLDGPPEQRRRLGEPCDPRSPAMHRPLVVRRGSPATPAAQTARLTRRESG
jgi:hypothetical protein